MADLYSTLSPKDRSNLGRNLGLTMGDGSKFQRGVVVSAQDAANSAGTSARNAAFSARTGPYGNINAPQDPNQAGAQAYAAYLNPQQQGQQGQQGMQGAQAQGQPQAGQPSPYEDMLNRARLTQASYSAASRQPAALPMGASPVGAGQSPAPSANPMASFGLPDGSTRQYGGMGPVQGGNGVPVPFATGTASYTRPDGSTRTLNDADFTQLPPTQGFGFGANPATADQQAVYAQQLSQGQGAAPSGPIGAGTPAPNLLRPRSVQEINAMSPDQRAGLVQFSAEQKAANAPKETKIQSYRSQDAQGNPIEVSVDQFGRPVGQGPVRPTSTTNIIGAKEEGEAEKVVGKAEGEFFAGLAESADKAAEAVANVEKIRSLYADNAYSGPGATVATKLKQIGATLGLIDANKAATQDELQAELSKGVLVSTKEFFKGMGALSNLEGSRAESAVANLSRTPEGNLRILEWQNANAPTIIEGNRLKEEARAEGKTVSEANAIARKFMRANYKKLADVKAENPASTPAANAPASPAASVQRIRNPKTGELRELRDGQWVPVK